MRMMLRSLESRLDALDMPSTTAAATGNGATRLAARPAAQPAQAPLLHLSFDDLPRAPAPLRPA